MTNSIITHGPGRRLALAASAVISLAACNSLEVANPNATDARRALSDPATVEAVAGGTVRTWVNTYVGMGSNGALVTQAQSYSASWNNFNMNFYSSIDADGTRNSRAWQNDLASAGRSSITAFWEGYYSTLSSAVDVLRAVRVNSVVVRNAADTRRAETIAQLMRGAALMGLALNYDRAFIINERTDVAAINFSNRRAVRDSAVAAFDDVIRLATANQFTTPAGWTNGRTYSNTQIAQLANTMAAITLADYPRSAAENAGVDWARVAQYAGRGISSGASFDFGFIGDGCNNWCHNILFWFMPDGGRVHTRVANLLDPATQRTPYPNGGNPRPNSPDRRLGDGSFGDEDTADNFGTIPRTPRGGTDFAWSEQELFNPARGQYHQSNIGHTRYDLSGTLSADGIYGGFGPAPLISAAQTDLILAEAEIRRSGGNLARAAELINRTRVGRGGLPPAAAGDGVAGLLEKLNYEKEIELLALGASPFHFRRRVENGLLPGTPREMPAPASELALRGEAFYTWGGRGPANSTAP
ncbi:MAG: hypothetical protein MUF00_15505 [Gemmatimonadaceae bacterium]|nr:hypothetical protein [Gemmatimonadaceae bacterium]